MRTNFATVFSLHSLGQYFAYVLTSYFPAKNSLSSRLCLGNVDHVYMYINTNLNNLLLSFKLQQQRQVKSNQMELSEAVIKQRRNNSHIT